MQSMRAIAPIVLSTLAALGCGEIPELGEVPAAVANVEVDAAIGPLIVAHAGQGSPADRSDGPAAAVERAFERLGADADPRVAAIAAIELLEDDPRFNAGTGANVRLDGRTIEADAALMDDQGRFGAVVGISGIRHPIRVAEAVIATPHLMLAGAGAQAFAGTLGLEPRSLVTAGALDKLRGAYAQLFADDGEWAEWNWRAHWNFETPAPANLEDGLAALDRLELDATAATTAEPIAPDQTRDTVGVVVRTAEGRYAAALSTGGTTLAIRGRVGDVPVLGAGLFAGPHGAVAATGKGEAIIRERVAAEVYARLEAGETPTDAIRLAIRNISPEEGVGVIAVSALGYGATATSQMAWAARVRDQRERSDTRIIHHDR